MDPLIIPAAPRPATARPTVSIAEETATPHKSEPSSNTAKKARNDHYGNNTR